jgi:hypothetical protein
MTAIAIGVTAVAIAIKLTRIDFISASASNKAEALFWIKAESVSSS